MDPTRTIAIVGGRVVTQHGIVASDLVVVDGRIDRVGPVPAHFAGASLDASGCLVAPGFVDLQVNGGHGIDLTRRPMGMWELGMHLLRDGVTSFLPTIVTAPEGTIEAALDALHRRPDGYAGAKPLGLHLEGPMINRTRAGAHPPAHIRSPSLELVAGWSSKAGITMVTLAPELDGAIEVVEALLAQGITVALGHSDATYEQVGDAVDAGATLITHLYNAMSPMHHRRPGVVGYALAHTDVTAGIIVDGLHSWRSAVATAWNAKGAGLLLVTDAAPLRGLAPGQGTLGDIDTTLHSDGGIRTANGTLAGSNLGMNEAVRNLVAWTRCDIEEAIHAASTVPAGVIGADSKVGIVPGATADLVLLDAELNALATVVGGRQAPL